MGGTCSTSGGEEVRYRLLVGKLERRSLGRPRRRVDNIRMDPTLSRQSAHRWRYGC
jgi:hypothetical protein